MKPSRTAWGELRLGPRAGLTLLLGALAGCRAPPAAPPPAPVRSVVTAPMAESSDPEPGDKPYELEWHPRREPRDAIEDFSFLLGWTVHADAGLEADFGRSRERPLWGEFTGRLRYHGTPPGGGRILVRPPQPMALQAHFDCVEVWVHGFPPESYQPGDPPGPRFSLHLFDAEGTAFEASFGRIDWGGWKLIRQRVPAEQLDRLAQPCRFSGFAFDGCLAAEPVRFYLDSLSFYLEEFPPLNLPSRPAPNRPLAPGEPPGLHRGPGRLDVPVDADAVRPPGAPGATDPVLAVPTASELLLRATTESGRLVYRFDPSAPGRGVSVEWNDRGVGRFLVGGGLQGPAYADAQLEVLRHDGDRIHVGYAGGLVMEYGLAGTSLIVDIRHRGGRATGFEAGAFDGRWGCFPVRIPGLVFADGSGPAVGWLDAPTPDRAGPLFFSLAFDWTRSHASRWIPARGGANGEGSFGAVEYLPGTDGRRRDVFERLVLTVAPRLEQVLPRPPNPPGVQRERLHPRVWVDSTGPASYAQAVRRMNRLADLGVTSVVQGHHAECFQDGWESSTFRVRAAPGRGGDDALRGFLDRQRAAGWLPGLFANYLNLHPLNQYWDESNLLRTPSREWIEGLPSHYLVKPPVAVEAAAYLRPSLVQLYGPAALFLQGMTDRPPWAFTDYDGRVPGAGASLQAYFCLAELMRAQSNPDWGPVIGESGAEAFYAGLFDGYLVTDRRREGPLLPLFQLQALNPRAAAFGVGPWRLPGEGAAAPPEAVDAALDHYLAAQIAYGVVGRLAPDHAGPVRQARSYYLMADLQTHYAGQAPRRIAYWNGEHFLNTSEAVTQGALTRGQLYLLYPDAFELWINGSAALPWDVRVGASTWRLPPSGWVAAGRDFLEVSAIVEGRRMDYLETPGFRYYDGRGGRQVFRGLSSPTPIVLRRSPDSDAARLEIIDVAGAGDFRFHALLEQGEGLGRAAYLGPGRSPLGDGVFEQTDGLYHPPAGRSALRYVVEINSPRPPPPPPAVPEDWSRILAPVD